MSSEEGSSGGFQIPFVSDILKEGEKMKIPFVSDMIKEGEKIKIPIVSDLIKEGEQLKIPFISDRSSGPAGEEGHRECCCNGCFGGCDKVKEWWHIFVEKIKEFFSCLGSCCCCSICRCCCPCCCCCCSDD